MNSNYKDLLKTTRWWFCLRNSQVSWYTLFQYRT